MIQKKEIHHDFGDILKHEARVKLWLPALKDLYKELQRPLKYFTLPGPNAYDVMLWEKNNLIKYDGRGYPDVCFCEMDPDNFISAKGVLGNTRGIKAKFESIIRSGPRDQEFKAFWEFFPYDVYNLDFCGTWFEEEEPVSETFRAIINLVNQHVAWRGSRQFLLFLTIRIDPGRMNAAVVDDLKNNLKDNRDNPNFAQVVSPLIPTDVESFIRSNFHTFVLVSIPKLIGFKLIPQTRRMAGKICEIKRAFYIRHDYKRRSYKIGKFIFKIMKERPSLRVNPPSYCECVRTSFKTDNILHIGKEKIARAEYEDLQSLKSRISHRKES